MELADQQSVNGGANLKSKEKRSKDWSSEERITALITTGSISPEECVTWCPKKGIFPHHLEQRLYEQSRSTH